MYFQGPRYVLELIIVVLLTQALLIYQHLKIVYFVSSILIDFFRLVDSVYGNDIWKA